MLCCSWSQEIDLSSLIRNGGPNLYKIKEKSCIYLAPNLTKQNTGHGNIKLSNSEKENHGIPFSENIFLNVANPPLLPKNELS